MNFDYYVIQKSISYINGILAIFMFTLIVSSYYLQKLLFTVWTLVLFFTGIGIFSCYLPEVVQRFGDMNATTIYGLIHLGPVRVLSQYWGDGHFIDSHFIESHFT